MSRSITIPATAPSDKPDRWVLVTSVTVRLLVVQLHVSMGVGPLLATCRDGVTETLGDIWIRNGSWEPTVLLDSGVEFFLALFQCEYVNVRMRRSGSRFLMSMTLYILVVSILVSECIDTNTERIATTIHYSIYTTSYNVML